jgi:hypothetical protein
VARSRARGFPRGPVSPQSFFKAINTDRDSIAARAERGC